MQRIGLRGIWLIAGLLVAVVPALWMWGFTVDDALISVRYARHLAAGLGWRFDAGGPSTDGVTPLPWPLLLAPLARADALTVLFRAKVLGLLSWGAAGGALGAAIGAEQGAPRWAHGGALAVLGLSVPVAAHAVSGMETALATCLASLAVLSARRPLAVAILAGAAASLRPEMAPWACALSAGLALAAGRGPERASGLGLLSLVPFGVCALVRVAVWGRPAPLALEAKPSDLAHGLAYAGAACVVTVVPVLLLAPVALGRCRRAMAVALAGLCHLAAVVAAGGDWMPYARLVTPVVPGFVYAAVLASGQARPATVAVRTLAAAALAMALVGRGGTGGRRVGADREALVRAAEPVLAGARRVASLDIGWVSAASDADIIDLAGVTDPIVAALPGGHTSKRVDGTFLLERDPDVLLLYAPTGLGDGGLEAWREASYPRRVEARLADDVVVASHFVASSWLPLGPRGAGYVVLRRVR